MPGRATSAPAPESPSEEEALLRDVSNRKVLKEELAKAKTKHGAARRALTKARKEDKGVVEARERVAKAKAKRDRIATKLDAANAELNEQARRASATTAAGKQARAGQAPTDKPKAHITPKQAKAAVANAATMSYGDEVKELQRIARPLGQAGRGFLNAEIRKAKSLERVVGEKEATERDVEAAQELRDMLARKPEKVATKKRAGLAKGLEEADKERAAEFEAEQSERAERIAAAPAKKIETAFLRRQEKQQAEVARLEKVVSSLPASPIKKGRQRELNEARIALDQMTPPTIPEPAEILTRQEPTEAEQEAENKRRALESLRKQRRDLLFDIRALIGPEKAAKPGTNTRAKIKAKLEILRGQRALAAGQIKALEKKVPVKVVKKMTLTDAARENANINDVSQDRKTDRTQEGAPTSEEEEAAIEQANEEFDEETGAPGEVTGDTLYKTPRKSMPAVVRAARIAARGMLDALAVTNPGAYQSLLGLAAALRGSRRLQGQSKLPPATLYLTKDKEGPTLRSLIRGVKEYQGKDVIDRLKSWAEGALYREPGDLFRIRPDRYARERRRDEGMLKDLNDGLAKNKLLTSEPGADPERAGALREQVRAVAAKSGSSMGDGALNTAAREIDNALVDTLEERSRDLGTKATAAKAPKVEPHTNVAKKQAEKKEPIDDKAKAEKLEEPKEGGPVIVAPIPDPEERDSAGGDDEGIERNRNVRRAQERALPTREPVTSAWMKAEGLNEDAATDEQYEAADRMLMAYNDDKHGFLLGDGTGFGKTRELLLAAIQIARKAGKPALYLVPNKTIAQQAYRDARALGLTVARGSISGGEIILHVASDKDITAIDKLNMDPDSLSAVFVDEAQKFQNPAAIGRRRFVDELFK